MSNVSEKSGVDPRVRRTKRLIVDALLHLAEERDVADITVSDITTRAEVHRATFYLHYRDKSHLVSEALDKLFDEGTAEGRAFVEAHGRLTPDRAPLSVVNLFRHASTHPKLYRSLLAQTGSGAFAARLIALHEQQFLSIWHDRGYMPTLGSVPLELRARAAAVLTQSMIRWWLECGEGEDAQTMASWLWTVAHPLWFEDIDAEQTHDGPDEI